MENFITPGLDELYKTEPYSELLPYIIPAGLSFRSSYLTVADEISDPDKRRYLSVIFDSEDSDFEIKISAYDGKIPIADPGKAESYKLDLYYGPIENEGAVGADLPNVFVPFYASDINRKITADRIYTFSDGLCKAEISILCGDHIVSYGYNGPEITAEDFYDVIMSSNWFAKKH